MITNQENVEKTHSPIRRPMILTLICLIFGGILLLIGGRWDWVQGWLMSGLFLIFVVGGSIWTEIYSPEMSKERTKAVSNPHNLHERIMLILIPFLLLLIIIVSALDGGRYRWSQVPLWLTIIGFLLFLIYFILNMWAAVTNTFLSATVRLQEDRDQYVVEGGIYRFVRHPMYLGLCLLGIGLPVGLGSWYGLIPGGLFILTFIYRTNQEDRFLQENLPGYVEYTKKTRYRLFPGIW
jgi:protein-S-isoprenylcysteine O-methyltransferase Ste14